MHRALVAAVLCSCSSAAGTDPVPRDKLTYVMIHLEAGYYSRLGEDGELPPGLVLPDEYMHAQLGWQRFFWPTLVDLVEQANAFGFELTLAMNPQWGEYILADATRLEQIRLWQLQGHEIAFHHHPWRHPNWNGYSNDPNAASEPLLLGDPNAGFSFVRDAAGPADVITSTMGNLPLDFPSSMVAPAGRDLVFGFGTWSDSYPGPSELRSLRPERKTLDITWLELPIRVLSTVVTADGLSVDEKAATLREQYLHMEADEVFGAVFHEFDFSLARDAYLDWFRFIKSQDDAARSMGEVAGLWSEEWLTSKENTQ